MNLDTDSKVAICYVGLIVVTFVIFYTRLYVLNRNQKRAESLFNNLLIPLCKNASTQLECNHAWNVLNAQCINAMSRFTIPENYEQHFYYLRGLLQEKLDNLKKTASV